jgi:hypothetical protein
MGFSSQDDLITQITAGKYLRREMSKITNPVGTAGGWHCLAGATGYPIATAYPSTQDLVWQGCSDKHGDAVSAALFGIQHGGDVATATKHIVNVGAMMVAAAGAPWQAKLVDLQGYYRISGANVTGTSSRTMINSNTVTFDDGTGYLRATTATNDFNTGTKVQFSTSGSLPTGISALTDYWITRVTATTYKISTSWANCVAGTYVAYTNAGSPTTTMRCFPARATNGVGCQAFFVVQTAPATGGPNLTASAYDSPTSTPGSGAQAFAGSPTFGAAADAYALRIPHSGNAAGRYGPFLPLASADLGIARVNSFTFNNGTAYTGSGVLALCIAKPILDIAIPVSGMWSERDLVNQLPSLPKIEDGACLVWLLFGAGATTANSPFNATLDVAWGG